MRIATDVFGIKRGMSRLETGLVEPRPVIVYTLAGCVSCSYARRVLRQRGVHFEERSGDGVRGFRGELRAKTGRVTVPQIVIAGEPVGGADDLARLDRKGVLLPLVRGERFPRAIVRRRLAPLPGRRYRVELVDRHGRVLKRRDAPTLAEAEAIAASLC